MKKITNSNDRDRKFLIKALISPQMITLLLSCHHRLTLTSVILIDLLLLMILVHCLQVTFMSFPDRTARYTDCVLCIIYEHCLMCFNTRRIYHKYLLTYWKYTSFPFTVGELYKSALILLHICLGKKWSRLNFMGYAQL